MLTDPNLPLWRAGPLDNGTGVLTEFEVEAAPADDPDKPLRRSRFAKATADLQSAGEAAAGEISDKKRQVARSPGPSISRSTANEDTAGASTPARVCAISLAKPCSLAEKPIAIPAGTI